MLHSRQNILKKSIEFMRDRLGWAASSPALASAQARVSGDAELQSMMELLRKANILGIDTSKAKDVRGYGPLTGPADVDGANIFEKSFSQKSAGIPEEAVIEEDTDAEGDERDVIGDGDGEDGFGDLGSGIGPRRTSLKRTFTDISSLSLQAKLMEALAQPYSLDGQSSSYNLLSAPAGPMVQNAGGSSLHSHSSKWAPASQAVFRTDAKAPWTILAANDLACLVFGVTRAEVRKLGILEVVQEDRRTWLEEKLRGPGAESDEKARASANCPMEDSAGKKPLVGSRGGITAQLLSKTPAREKAQRRAQTDDGSGGYYKPKTPKNHPATKSRGVLLCGDVVPIQKRNGSTGSASFWVMEKRGGLIWVLEEIVENVAYLKFEKEGSVTEGRGDVEPIWGQERIKKGTHISALFAHLPPDCVDGNAGELPSSISKLRHFTAHTVNGIDIPTTITPISGPQDIRVSCFPHIAGVMVLAPSSLKITSSNAVFSSALFGRENPDGLLITDLIPGFDDLLRVLTEEDKVDLIDGIVIPEHSFRRARALIALREGKANAASIFLQPSGLPARHRDGGDLMVDVQMRVVKSESVFPVRNQNTIDEESEDSEEKMAVTEVVYALWITYSRQLHSIPQGLIGHTSHLSRPITPPNQPSPGQAAAPTSPQPQSSSASTKSADSSQLSLPNPQLQESVSAAFSDEPLEHPGPNAVKSSNEVYKKKTISDFIILEEMGSGAYGQVKLARYKKNNSRKMVLKYVTKRRILVDTWTRDRRLGTVPLEIHVMDYLRRDGFRHPNIVEMVDFFEDDINYYIEMLPHGIPGMDLFDYIELRTNMEEGECRSIFKQVVDAIHHLHTKALVVHRDIKDENVVLDGEGRIKLIDFGSAAYIKNGPFDVFVGTIGKLSRTPSILNYIPDCSLDYAAPEVLQGKAYRGKEQDVWALGILLYTIVYKENPFYNIDEILDHPLRVPFIPFSEACIDLIRKMLDRDVDERITITEVMEHAWITAE